MDSKQTLAEWLAQAVKAGQIPANLAQQINRMYPGATMDALPAELLQALNSVTTDAKPARQALARTGSEGLARQLIDGPPV